MQNIVRQISRRVLYKLIPRWPRSQWEKLRYYPHIIPTDTLLSIWQQSEWPEYQEWISQNSINTTKEWLKLHKQAKSRKAFPRISIISPVFNTEANILETCILSVRLQTSPFWEPILVDDGSTKKETHEILEATICHDPRIQILRSRSTKSSGISAATNRGIQHASGDYILFLDHDDRLAPEAIQTTIDALAIDPDIDIVYSDRDMLSVENKRFMHLMKPDWSPENLYSGNYIFHMMCYRKQLLEKAGNLRSEYDGSQDYDLILRCMEFQPKVKHIPKILYHWRQHEQSVALDTKAKSYAFDAGIKALEDTLKRRNISGTVTENQSLWRGNYQIHLPPCDTNRIGIIRLHKDSTPDQYVDTIQNSHVIKQESQDFILIQHDSYMEKTPQAIELLASYLQLDGIGLISGRSLNKSDKISYAGITYDTNGKLLLPYSGYPADEPGYMAITQTLRNISGPDPFSVMISRELWNQLGGFNLRYKGPYALLDFALQALQANWRLLYNGQSVFICDNNLLETGFCEQDKAIFQTQWQDWLLKGDPYYNPNFSKQSNQYELNIIKRSTDSFLTQF